MSLGSLTGSLGKKIVGGVGQQVMSPELAAYLASLPPAGGGPDLSFLNDPNNPYYQQPDSGSSGGGYGYAAPTVQPILETSPEWTAYLNALGLEKSQFAADIERQRALAKSQTEYNLSQIGPQYDQQRRGITASAEGRGMARSGAFQRDLAENKANETRMKAGVQQGLDSTLSNLESQLAQKNMDLASRQAGQQLSMIGQGYKSDPLAGLSFLNDPRLEPSDPNIARWSSSLTSISMPGCP